MAYSLSLPAHLKAQGWKVKIRDRERSEPPHATIIRGTRAWRFGLREIDFLDVRPDPVDVPDELLGLIRAELAALVREWDAMYPHNPVHSLEDDE